MFTKNSRKGFTIVELVIVIAIIAILATALIPTFGGLIDSANATGDQALVRNLNTVLTVDEVTNGKDAVNKVDRAIRVAGENGYSVAKLTPTSKGNYIVFNEDTNRFELIAKSKLPTENPDNIWLIRAYESDFEANSPYSQYLAYPVAEGTTLSVAAGLCVGENAGVSVNYTSEAAHTVTFIMNGGILMVNNKNADVHSYGEKDVVNITAVANASYHEHGTVAQSINVTTGHIVVEKDAEVAKIEVVAEATEASISIEAGATVPVIENAAASADVSVEAAAGADVGAVVGIPADKVMITNADSTIVITDRENYIHVARIGTTLYETFRAAILAAKADDTIVLLKDATAVAAEPYTVLKTKGSFTIDLNGCAMTYDGTGGSVSYQDAALTIKNGTFNATGYSSTGALFVPQGGASLYLHNLTMETKNCTPTLAMGNAALVDIQNVTANSLGSCSYFAGTNANSVDNYNVVINIENSTIGKDGAYTAPVIVNVPSKLNIDGCDITGSTQTVIVRSGEATIKNSTLRNKQTAEGTWSYFDAQTWGSGNSVAVSVLTVGDRAATPETKSAYVGNASVDLRNVQFVYDETIASAKAVYVWGGQTDTTGRVKTATVTYDAACDLNTDAANGKVDIIIGSESGGSATLK